MDYVCKVLNMEYLFVITKWYNTYFGNDFDDISYILQSALIYLFEYIYYYTFYFYFLFIL